MNTYGNAHGNAYGTIGVEAQTMDRGSDAAKYLFTITNEIDIQQTRKGCLQEFCCGCEAKTEFKYFVIGEQVAHSLEDADCCCRIFFPPCHPFQMRVTDNSEAELLTVDRPCACAGGSCKCCCYQGATVFSGGERAGEIKEICYFCVPEYHVMNETGEGLYRLHPPTCCCGVCINCCTEGNSCMAVCCKLPFHLFPFDMKNTEGAAPLGKIVKRPKSIATEIFTDAEAFKVKFPMNATVPEKATIVGAAILINAIHFENGGRND